ncbi:hypothetical protein, partial [Xanthomonas phaseoli]|uniref:hypothetical protein n=1 Tax=Xanthomonas phaseoli TaxID=1985254 RepID=UPI001C558118
WASKNQQQTHGVERAVPSPLAGHAVNPSMGDRWRHPCRQRSRNRQGHRTNNWLVVVLKSEDTASRGLMLAC